MKLRKKVRKLCRWVPIRMQDNGGADALSREMFLGSRAYWEERSAVGGNSGVGSYGKFAEFKAEVVSSFVDAYKINTVIEFGCGNGNQSRLTNYSKH
jgi:hypothetical protein